MLCCANGFEGFYSRCWRSPENANIIQHSTSGMQVGFLPALPWPKGQNPMTPDRAPGMAVQMECSHTLSPRRKGFCCFSQVGFPHWLLLLCPTKRGVRKIQVLHGVDFPHSKQEQWPAVWSEIVVMQELWMGSVRSLPANSPTWMCHASGNPSTS